MSFFLNILQCGVTLWAEEKRIRYRIASGTLPFSLSEEIRQHREDIITLLEENKKYSIASLMQQRLWFLDQWQPGSSTYNMSTTLRVRGTLAGAALEQSLQEIVQRHEVLRTHFMVVEGQPIQVIEAQQKVQLPVISLREIPEEVREDHLQHWLEQEAQRPFSLETGPLLRAQLVEVKEQEHVLLLCMHHIISDGWSMGVLLRELAALYTAYIAGEPSPLPALPVQYADFALWQREWLQGEVLQEQLTYWRQRLEGAPALLELPTDHPRPAVQSYRGAHYPFQLSEQMTRELKALSQREGSTLFMTLLAAFQTLLMRYSGQEDLVVGTPIANRTRVEIEPLIGFFVNTLVVRTDLSENPSFREVLRRVRQQMLEAYAHQDLPFERLVEELQPERSLSYAPLFQVMFAYHSVSQEQISWSGLMLEPMEVEAETSKFDLTLFVHEDGGVLWGSIEYSTDLFEEATIARMVGHFQTLLAGLLADPEQPIGELALLTEAERVQVLEEWNATQVPYSQDKCIHQLFEEQVQRTPEAVAVVFEEKSLTYRQLDQRANALAWQLQEAGVGPEMCVGVYVERSLEMLVGVLGVLKAGGVYVPLDPAYPRERVLFVLVDAQVSVLLTQQRLMERVPQEQVQVIWLDSYEGAEAEERVVGPQNGVQSSNLAYVIYTSGSTGTPKGVMATHQGVVNYLNWSAKLYLAKADGGTSYIHTSLAFDLTVTSLFSPILVGNRVHLVSPRLGINGLGQCLSDKATHRLIKITPAHLELLGQQLPILESTIKNTTFVVGGEKLVPSHLNAWQNMPPNTIFFNEYGPTETLVGCCVYQVPKHKQDTVMFPIGRPAANTQMYVLDIRMQLVPVGVVGELYVGGVQLARGYLDRPELTAERFIPNPFSTEIGARLYRTGDTVRWLPNGILDFIGRMDRQVKIRGYRIELGEIEATLAKHPEVQEALVIVHGERTEEKTLVAYLVGSTSTERVENGELRAFLRQTLPDYMLPLAFVWLETFPLSPNGKVDSRAFPAPMRIDRMQGGELVGPGTQVEELLVGIWQQVLGVERVGIYDSFFELGGHSLLATQLLSRIRTIFQVKLSLQTLFQRSTIAELAELVVTEQQMGCFRALIPLQSLTRPKHVPLSFAQQRLWFLDRWSQGSSTYNIAVVFRLKGLLRVESLTRSLNEIVRRHEALRTRFAEVEGQLVQVIEERQEAMLSLVSLKEIPEKERVECLHSFLTEEAQRPFSLETGPLFRIHLVALGKQEHVLLLCMHHIISDGWSMEVLFREVGALYAAFEVGQPSQLPELPVQYADFALWQREWLQGEVLQEQLTYWRQRLEGAPALLELPTDHPRPAVQSYRGAHYPFQLSEQMTRELKALSQREGSTLFMTLLAAFQTLLMRYSGQEDLVVGTPIANRTRVEIEPLIGFFVNTLVVRTDLSENPSFREVLRRVRQQMLEAYAHQDLPFERLVEELQPERSLSYAPLFQVMFELQQGRADTFSLPHLTVESLSSEIAIAKFDLTMVLTQTEREIEGVIEYSTDLFEEATIARMVGHFQTLLAGLLADPEQPIGELALLTEAERVQVLEEWNATQVPYSQDKCIHQLFEEQVQRTPEAVAVVFEEKSLTYRQLDQRANALAWQLQEAGVGPEMCVGVYVERSLEMIIGLLGILKAGGAYVPLEPSAPSERLAFILTDSQISLILTQQSLQERLPDNTLPLLCLDRNWHSVEQQPQTPPVVPCLSDQLAYVIYTSGSTGTPKGVMVCHAQVSRLFAATYEQFQISNRDVWTLFHSYAFDFSVWELWGALLYGGQLIIVPYWVSRAPDAFYDLLTRHRVTVLNQTPSAFRQLIDIDRQELNRGILSLRLVIFGGEALDLQSLRPWFQRYGDQYPQLVNMYGITETTVHVTWQFLTRHMLEEDRNGYIGRPLPDLQIYILNKAFHLVPPGVAGEIYVGGAGLSRGYLARPDLTAERFIPHPFSDKPGVRLYKTGDVARQLPNGLLEYVGRNDHQIKIRGFRIELGEIEAVLHHHPAVRQAAVTTREEALGEKQLVAYIVTEQQQISKDEQLFQLPNHLHISHLNRSETEWIYNEIFVEQSYLKHGITLTDGDCVFDVGANIGLFTLFVQQRCPHAQVYAFEPIPPIFEALHRNVTLYGLNTYLFQCGLSNETKEAKFTFHPHFSAMSSAYADEKEDEDASKVTLYNQDEALAQHANELLHNRFIPKIFTCQLRTLSDIMYENAIEHIDLLKVDVEKSELDVLKGIQEEDWAKIKQIVVEVYDRDGRLDQIVELLKRHGYQFVIEQADILANTGLYNIYALNSSQVHSSESETQTSADTWSPLLRKYGVTVAELQHFLQARLPDYMIPAFFVFLETLPLTPNGKVDRQELANQPITRVEEHQEHLPPRNLIELQLIQIWETILGINPISVTDNFFSLGGHSLLAVQLINQIQKQFGCYLPIFSIFQGQTVEQLALILRQEKVSLPWSSLVKLQGGSRKTPIFLVHPGGGTVVCYAALVPYMENTQPIYGLQSSGLHPDIYGEHPVYISVKEMADVYLDAMLSVQPQGPYILGGWSAGGVIAFEIAQILKERGQEVALLALLDSHAPVPSTYKSMNYKEALWDFVVNLCDRSDIIEKNLNKDLSEEFLLEYIEVLMQYDNYFGDKKDIKRLVEVYQCNSNALVNYNPKPYLGPVVLLRTEMESTNDSLEQMRDSTLNWSKICSQTITVETIPCSHKTMLSSSNAQIVAKWLQRYIDDVSL